MRLRHIPGAEETIAASPYVVQDPQAQKGRWDQLFGNTNPIEIEVGMGKGRFIMELAHKNPGINYIGIERYSSVLLRGLQKRAELELDNIFFMCIDAKTLADVFAPGEVNRIYLNFSDPWTATPSAVSPRRNSWRFTTACWPRRARWNSRPTTAACSIIPWNPFPQPAGP